MAENNLTDMPALVTPDWLAAQLSKPDICVLDASWHLPTEERDAGAEYESEHIPGAVFFDIDAVSDLGSPLPHMLPTVEFFALKMAEMGISHGIRIVVYDSHGLMSAARVWWMFRAFGHENVSVLNGGLPAWKRAGHPVKSSRDAPPAVSSEQAFTASLNPSLVRSLDQILGNLTSQHEQLIDARSTGRFAGIDPEPRAGLRRGHVPGSYNVPFQDLLDPEVNQVLPPDQIEACFLAAGIDLSQPIATTCGSGITACIVALALHTIGRTGVAVYDGSWAEWGELTDTPVDTVGAAE